MRNFSMIVLGILVLVISNSCKHKKSSEYVGPSICPSGSFRFVNDFKLSSPSAIDFTRQFGDTITASFSESVSWTITIEGLSSGATKVYQEHSSAINLVWQGEPGVNRIFFVESEHVKISLTIPCVETKSYNIMIMKASDFSLFGAVMSDFDGGGYSPSIIPIHYSGANPNFVNGPLVPPQGKTYLNVMGGPTTTWYGGGIEFGGPTMINSSNPDSVYFNAYLSSGNNTTTILQITLTSGGSKLSNQYNVNIPINWRGWRFVSYPLSAFKNASGTSMLDAKKTTYVDFGLDCATQTGQSTEANLDFVIFTYNKPFFQ